MGIASGEGEVVVRWKEKKERKTQGIATFSFFDVVVVVD